ncbi:Rieske 2Fe-2S domain-containing protein [Burkholderia pyrrocinia]|uniref:Rieske 2Fe-2S domain-containing protein n=1 Tax=Burkholderia pyrrocinia TaxID=60550 RepID=UPI0038B69B30
MNQRNAQQLAPSPWHAPTGVFHMNTHSTSAPADAETVAGFSHSAHKLDAPPVGRLPLPYPNGWFAACFSDELKSSSVLRVPFMGQELVLYRTKSGQARAINPYCPHLGAHLGYGGRVDGENLICPFHGFVYGPDGACLRTCDNGKPPTIALSQHFARELNGVIFVWRDDQGRAPFWELPAHDESGYSQHLNYAHELSGFSMDMTENAADVKHFAYLHRLPIVSFNYEEEKYRTTYSLKIKTTRILGESGTLRMTIYGVGYLVNETLFDKLGLVIRAWAFGTQTQPLSWTFRVVITIHNKHIARLPRAFRRLAYALPLRLIQRWFIGVARQDYPVWGNRRFIRYPKLAKGEVSMAAYRRWAAQFYPNLADETIPTPAGNKE